MISTENFDILKCALWADIAKGCHMYASDPLAPSLHAHLWQSCPDRPVLYFSPKSLQENYRRFASGFDGLVT